MSCPHHDRTSLDRFRAPLESAWPDPSCPDVLLGRSDSPPSSLNLGTDPPLRRFRRWEHSVNVGPERGNRTHPRDFATPDEVAEVLTLIRNTLVQLRPPTAEDVAHALLQQAEPTPAPPEKP